MPAAGQAREATVTQQAVTVLVQEHPAPESEKPPGTGHHRPRPSRASPPSPAAPPARACDAHPLAGFGSDAGTDQYYVLDAAHPTKGMTSP